MLSNGLKKNISNIFFQFYHYLSITPFTFASILILPNYFILTIVHHSC